MLIQFLGWYFAVGLIAIMYFILFVHIPVMEEFKPIMFRRELNMPGQYKFPVNVVGLMILAVAYPWFIYQTLLGIMDNTLDDITEDFIETYRDVLWHDIEKENNV